jgi:hypothetical protein
MLRNIAQLLTGLLDQERKTLDKYDVKHGPTIGQMYEGLTADVLNRAIPQELGLQIVSGVIFDDSGLMTGQIDCMVVKGVGESIPYTNSFKWHIKDVIAVFEVKKTLYSDDLSDAFHHVRGVLDSYGRYIQSCPLSGEISISAARKAFAETTKKIAPSYSELKNLSFADEMIFHTLVIEQLSPVRIILGYHGFQSEYSFREAMFGFLQKNMNQRGFGVGSFPQLIISEKFSLIKANGQPYSAPMRNEYWDFYTSSPENPLIFVLELIWTRLQRDFKVGGLWGDDLQMERMHIFLSCRAMRKDGILGWEYRYTPISKEILLKESVLKEWSPAFLDQPQFVVINKLCRGTMEEIDDPELISYVEANGWGIENFTNSLLETGLVAMDGKRLILITEMCQCAILPTGQYVAGDNNFGRLSRWIEKQSGEKE